MQKLHHNTHDALELEFYIPVVVWDHPATDEFLSGVYSLVEGATILGGAKGVWRGETETTNLVRIVVREAELKVDEVLGSLRVAINRLMAAWATSAEERQDSFMFTARPLTVYDTIFEK